MEMVRASPTLTQRQVVGGGSSSGVAAWLMERWDTFIMKLGGHLRIEMNVAANVRAVVIPVGPHSGKTVDVLSFCKFMKQYVKNNSKATAQ